MANNNDAFTPEYWSKRVQILLKQSLVCRALANFEEQATLRNGDIVHRPYMGDVVVNDYTKGTAVTPQDTSGTDEYLTINKFHEVTIYMDEVDEIQNKYDVVNKYTARMAYQMQKKMDGTFLAEVSNATYSLDNADFGGTAGTGVDLTTSNIIKWFSKAKSKLNYASVEDTSAWFAVITPDVEALMTQAMINQGFRKADDAMAGTGRGNGLLGRFMDFDVYSSTQVLHTNKLTTTAIAIDTETVTVNGVVFTADADGAAVGAGHWSIQATADLCWAQLADAINGSGTAGVDTYIDVSAADRAILKRAGVTASYSAGTDILTITSY